MPNLTLMIRPAVSPDDRHFLEDVIVERLEEAGLEAECVGGGTMLDGSSSDLEFAVRDAEVAGVLAVIRTALELYKGPHHFEVVQGEPEPKVHEV